MKDVLSPTVVEHFGEEITRKVIELNPPSRPMEERSTYDRAFIQIVNLWRHSEVVKRFVMGSVWAGSRPI